MNWQISRPTQQHIPQIHEVFSKTVINNFREEGILDTLEEEAHQEVATLINTLQTDFATQGQEEYFLIAHAQNKVVGTIAYGKVSTLISENVSIGNSNIPEVKSVYVLPEFQNQGIGSLLFQRILLVLTQHNIEAFYLDSGYRKAKTFWQKKLGAPTYTLENYWGKGSHHMIWYCLVKDCEN